LNAIDICRNTILKLNSAFAIQPQPIPMKILSAHSHKPLIRLRGGKILSSHMKKIPLALALLVAAVAFSPLGARAQSTYTTLNGTVNLVAGLTNLTSFEAISTSPNLSTGIQFITDGSWSTGIQNLGHPPAPSEGTLAGSFGGATYFGSSNGIILIGLTPPPPFGYSWGSYTIRLLLSDDTYSSPISFYGDYDSSTYAVNNRAVTMDANSQFYTIVIDSLGAAGTAYHELDIGAFDTSNIGFKGIELSNFSEPWADLYYIGVTSLGAPDPSPVPESGQVAASLLLLAGIGGYVWMKRRKTAKPATAAA
jgi:hypothetical protein